MSAFVFDAIAKSVFAFTGSGTPRSLTPSPPSVTTFPPSMRLKPTPGTSKSFIPVERKSFRAAIIFASTGCAFFPANVSRA